MPDPAPTASLEFQITVAAWRRIPRLRAHLKKAAEVTAQHLPKKLRVSFSANVLLTGNAKVRQLNHDFRGIDKPTNVLSFPQFAPADIPKMGRTGEVLELGDIAIANQYVVSEAKSEHKLLLNHTIHLVIHGLLHLFGYDHIDDKEALSMESLETKIMEALGLLDPYELREATKTRRPTTGKRR